MNKIYPDEEGIALAEYLNTEFETFCFDISVCFYVFRILKVRM
jgi:hypothetical protein